MFGIKYSYKLGYLILVIISVIIIFFPPKEQWWNHQSTKKLNNPLHEIINEVTNITSCAIRNPYRIIKRGNGIAITINSSKVTKDRLCSLISFLSMQAKQLTIAISITIFIDEIVYIPPFCSGDKVEIIEWESTSGHERYYSKVPLLVDKYHKDEKIGWILFIDDDTVVFLHNLFQLISNYNSSIPYGLGGVSEEVSAILKHGSFAYGGGGMLFTYAALETIVPIFPCCKMQYRKLYGGDEKLARCISDAGIPFIEHTGFHQLDIQGDLSGYIEGVVSKSPVITIHHLYVPSIMLYPIDVQQTMVNSLFSSYLLMKEKQNFLKRILIYGTASSLSTPSAFDHSLEMTLQVTSGYSVVLISGHRRFSEILLRIEKTFTFWNTATTPLPFREINFNQKRLFFSCIDSYSINHQYSSSRLQPDDKNLTVRSLRSSTNFLKEGEKACSFISNFGKSRVWRYFVYSLERKDLSENLEGYAEGIQLKKTKKSIGRRGKPFSNVLKVIIDMRCKLRTQIIPIQLAITEGESFFKNYNESCISLVIT